MIAPGPAPGDLRPNPDWASLPLFDRKGWRRVRFGDVVKNVKETERDPAEAGIERFIGLEHLEPGSLHIRTWGNVADGTTFTRRCRPGQVLFGKRRAYQRKVAVAGFDAVVSGDIYVFTSAGDRLLPEFLPFICLSERFFQYAVETSAGSLSPRTNWKHLAEFEFDLPPLEQQRRIAELLWAVDDNVEAFEKVKQTVQIVQEATATSHFNSVRNQFRVLGAVVSSSAYGPRFSNSLYSPTGEIAQLRTTDLSDKGEINYESIPRVDLKAQEVSNHILKSGDFLISRSGTCGIGAVYHENGIPTVPGAFLIRLRLKDDLSPDYLREYVNSLLGKRHMGRLIAGGVQKNIRGSALLAEKIPIPSIDEQETFLKTIFEQQSWITVLSDSIYRTRNIQTNFINLIWKN